MVIEIDGAQGEGGGQVLRSALAMAMCTGQACAVRRVRAKRRRPGLMRQHLTAVQAAAEVCDGQLDGDALGSSEVVFRPGAVRPGEYHFAVGTAGSATLVLQTVLPALLTAPGPSVVRLEGGTHNPGAPPFDFLERSFLPLLGRMGPRVEVELLRPGFYPAGGGSLVVRVTPAARLAPLELPERGAVRAVRATARVAHLPATIAQRELDVVRRWLSEWSPELRIEEVPESAGPGNVLAIDVACEHTTEVCTGFGEKRRPAERVAAGAAREAVRYLRAQVAVGEHLADQLLLPMVLAGGGAITTLPPSLHARTNADVLARFVDVPVAFEELDQHRWRVQVG